jgi:hypothetical protein
VAETHRSPDNPDSVVHEIAAGVASLEDTTPNDLPPLYEVIDTEALEDLFRGGRGRVVFEYRGYEVTVYHDHSVEITPR